MYVQNGINLSEPQIAAKRKLTRDILSNMQAGLSVYDAIINAAADTDEDAHDEDTCLRILGLKFLLCTNCVNLVTCSNVSEVTQCMPND